MASAETLHSARKILRVLPGTGQSQVGLAQQAEDCVPIVEALGYYDLAEFLQQIADRA